MLAGRDDLEVLEAVVRPVAVLVMHVIVRREWSAERPFHDEAMLEHSPVMGARKVWADVDGDIAV